MRAMGAIAVISILICLVGLLQINARNLQAAAFRDEQGELYSEENDPQISQRFARSGGSNLEQEAYSGSSYGSTGQSGSSYGGFNGGGRSSYGQNPYYGDEDVGASLGSNLMTGLAAGYILHRFQKKSSGKSASIGKGKSLSAAEKVGSTHLKDYEAPYRAPVLHNRSRGKGASPGNGALRSAAGQVGSAQSKDYESFDQALVIPGPSYIHSYPPPSAQWMYGTNLLISCSPLIGLQSYESY